MSFKTRIYLVSHCLASQWISNNHKAMSDDHHLVNLKKKKRKKKPE